MSPNNPHSNLSQLPPSPPSESPISSEGKPVSWLSRSRPFLIGIGLGVGLTFIGLRFVPAQGPKETPPEETEAVAPSAGSEQAVTVAQANLTRVDRTLEATGTVVAADLLPVQSQANGLQVVQVLAEEGQRVEAGQVLVRLDNSVLAAQYEQAQAGVNQAEARLAELQAGAKPEEIARAQEAVRSAEARVAEAAADLDLIQKRVQRNKTLEAEGAIARDRLDEVLNNERTAKARLDQQKAALQEAKETLTEVQKGTRPEVIDQAKAQVAEAKAQVSQIAAQLNNTVIKAPRGGIIATRNAQVGDVTSGSSPLFEIIENGRLELNLTIPETQLSQVQAGQAVRISSDANPNLNVVGQIERIEPILAEESRQAIAKVSLPPSASLQPGMFLRGQIVTSAASGVTIPVEAALPNNDGNAIVFVVKPDKTVIEQPVTLGEILPQNQVEILQGLRAGDVVVVKGAAYLKDGDKVSIN